MHRAILLALLAGCYAEPDWVTSHGLKVYDDYGLAKERRDDIPVVTEYALQEALAHGFGEATTVRKQLDGTRMYLKREHLNCGPDKGCGGQYHPAGEYVLLVFDEACPIENSALVHEVMHHVLFATNGLYDYVHETPDLWNGAEVMARILAQERCDARQRNYE